MGPVLPCVGFPSGGAAVLVALVSIEPCFHRVLYDSAHGPGLCICSRLQLAGNREPEVIASLSDIRVSILRDLS